MPITVKELGDHSRSLAFLNPGTRVFVEYLVELTYKVRLVIIYCLAKESSE